MEWEQQLKRLERRIKREQMARQTAEDLLEKKSSELFEINKALKALNTDLEERVNLRTQALNEQRMVAETQARTDHLTGIGNRLALNCRLPDALRQALASGKTLTLFVLDLDHFKRVNDTWGHEAGDRVLTATARRLETGLRERESVFRLGGDEFAMVALECSDPAALAERLYHEVTTPITSADAPLFVGASIGFATAPGDTSDADELLRFADLASYHAKSCGGGIAAFDQELADRLRASNVMLSELEQAIEKDQIDVWLQPIVSARDGKMAGVEALARWCRDDGEMIPPGTFIPMAEQAGLIHRLGMAVLGKAAQYIGPLARQDRLGYVSVNLSPLQFNEPALVADILSQLESSGLDPNRLLLEITESALLTDTNNVRHIMAELARHGIQFALDDFGVGYSNLRYLQELPFRKLKIDRSFVSGSSANDGSAHIVSAMTMLAHQFGMSVVAEGIETELQLSWIRENDCDLAQGFGLARPMPIEAFVEWEKRQYSEPACI